MKIELKKLTKKYLPQVIIIGVAVVAFLVTLLCFVISNKTDRREFLFPSADDNSLVIEYRNLPKKSVQGDVQLFIDELLLGSSVERTRLLFSPETRVISCFQREGTLYLNLSSDLLFTNSGIMPLEQGAELLEKNIKLNFPEVETVELYVDGNLAFEKKKR